MLTGRRSTVSSMITHRRGGFGLSSSRCRAMRSDTCRSIASGVVWPMVPEPRTARVLLGLEQPGLGHRGPSPRAAQQ